MEKGDESVTSTIHHSIDRYCRLLKEVIAVSTGPVSVFNVVPCPRAQQNRLAELYNRLLCATCADLKIPFISIWDTIMEGEVVDPKYSAEHIHLNEHIVPVAVEKLAECGVDVRVQESYSYLPWRYAYRFPLGNNDTRIWGDAPLGINTEKFDYTEAVNSIIPRLDSHLPSQHFQDIHIEECCEGYVPLVLQHRENAKITCWESDERLRRRADYLFYFLGLRPVCWSTEVPAKASVICTELARLGPKSREQVFERIKDANRLIFISGRDSYDVLPSGWKFCLTSSEYVTDLLRLDIWEKK
jgi:hypothetical protein